MPIDSKQLATLSTSKFQPLIKVLISTIYAQPLRQTCETCCKERAHLKTNTKKTIKVGFSDIPLDALTAPYLRPARASQFCIRFADLLVDCTTRLI